MCVWQSHAPAGMAKLTGVAGCEGSANVDPARDRTPAAIAPSTTSRLVVMMILLVGLRTFRRDKCAPKVAIADALLRGGVASRRPPFALGGQGGQGQAFRKRSQTSGAWPTTLRP